MSGDDAAFVHEMREFSRLYARRIGVFRGRALGLDYSLPEARVIEEVGRRPGGWVAIELAQYLGMDRSYMTRVLNGLEKKGLLHREPAPDDARKKRLFLTVAGETEAGEIERRSDEQMQAALGPVTATQKKELRKAVAVLEKYFSWGGSHSPPCSIPLISSFDAFSSAASWNSGLCGRSMMKRSVLFKRARPFFISISKT